MAAAQIIQAIVGVIGQAVSAIGQYNDSVNQASAAQYAKQQQRKGQSLQSDTIGNGNFKQADVQQPTSKTADYVAAAASEPSLATSIGGYLSGSSPIDTIAQISQFHASGANKVEAISQNDAASRNVGAAMGSDAISEIGSSALGSGSGAQDALSAEGKNLGLEGKSYVGAEDYLQSLHQGIGGINGN